MNTNVYNDTVSQTLKDIQNAFQSGTTKTVAVNGNAKTIPYPFPSPVDWRDTWIYFLMIDRFSNPVAGVRSLSDHPVVDWNQQYHDRQGGTFKGIESQLDYLKGMGVTAIWLTPVLKNAMAPSWKDNYHGYGIQDFLTIDGRFASTGFDAGISNAEKEVTAEKELISLIEAAHARGIYVILDIVINHSARVFDYILNGAIVADPSDKGLMNAPLGSEPSVEWLDGKGNPNPHWINTFPAGAGPTADDAVWPSDLQRADFFRRRGNKLSDAIPKGANFVMGDFDVMRQMVMEYSASADSQHALRTTYGIYPVLSILIMAYWHLIAKFDIDAFRIDSVKYVDSDMVELFGNAIREFAQSIGKRNFFTFGEIYDNEATIGNFVGRNHTDGLGIDAALDFPLFYMLPGVAKGLGDVNSLRTTFSDRTKLEAHRLSSHGEAGKYFVTFLDNHDQHQRFNDPRNTQPPQVLLGLAILFCLQGIPSLYYGTEQGLQGTILASGEPDLSTNESSREALWGKPAAFDTTHPIYKAIQKLAQLRKKEVALSYGRLYFREVSGNGQDFGPSQGAGGVVTFSRMLAGREVWVAANTNTTHPFKGFVLADTDTNRSLPGTTIVYDNLGPDGPGAKLKNIPAANFYDDQGRQTGTAEAIALYVELAPMQVQVIVPA